MSDAAMLSLVVVMCLVCVAVRRIGRRHILSSFLFLIAGAWVVLTGMAMFGLSSTAAAAAPPPAASPGNPCPADAPVKAFNVSLINIPIFLNRFGDVVPEGRMYILDENIATARATFQKAADPYHPDDVIQPLTLRANKGDCVQVNFTNRLNEPAPDYNRDDSIFPLPGEKLKEAGTVTPDPREFAPSRNKPENDFDPATAPPASMHFEGLDYDVRGSDGAAVGNNPNSTVQPGASITYRLHASVEGQFQFKDAADLTNHAANAGKFIGSNGFGAFGGFIVEPKGTTWVDTHTGQPINSGTEAIIKDPNGPDFREHTLFMHDEVQASPGILTRFCRSGSDADAQNETGSCVDPTDDELAKLKSGTLNGLGGGDANALVNGEVPVKLAWFAFNYRSEPGYNREEVGCPALNDPTRPFNAPKCIGEETSLSSWPFGDPGGGDLVVHDYRNEPEVNRLFHTAQKETHTFHEHVMRWPAEPGDEGGLAKIANPPFHTNVTNPEDVQSVSPGSAYALIMEGGAGSPHDNVPGSIGDIIFHCHLYPHFAEGMWGLDRIHDVSEDGTRTNPDGTPILRLQPLDDFQQPPAPTPEKPGFPFFLPGVFGFKGPKPPDAVPSRLPGGAFPPTALETAAAQPNAKKPGSFFVDHCPATAPVKRFDVAAIQLDATYSPDLKWHNPQERIYVLQSDKAAILAGTKKPEPFTPLLNVGDCVEYHLTNELPTTYGGTVFDRLQTTNEVSIHQHLVEFDVLSSDGAANGWNYDEGADPGQTITYRDFVQDDIKTNSFHDHFFPNVHQDAGLLGGGVVYPAGCKFTDPTTGKAVTVGTIVDVRCDPVVDYHGKLTNGKDARSVALFNEDDVPMFAPEDPNNPNDDQFVTTLPNGSKGVPIYPAKFPSSNEDRGAMGVNYSLEPFEARRTNGPANLFDSKTNGDPATPLPRAYAGDKVDFHLYDLSMEESHGFNLHRFDWKYEPDDPTSRLQQAQHIGMLEYFEADIPIDKENPDPKGFEIRDYLWNYGGMDDWFEGDWGLLRVSGCDFNKQISSLESLHKVKFPQLQQLPDNQVSPCNQEPNPTRTPGNPCPTDANGNVTAPMRTFHVAAINKDIKYNNSGDHDPNGLMYVLADDVPAIQNGTKAPEPLMIRANQGDCIDVTLDNLLDPTKMQPNCFEAIEPGQLATTAARTYPACIDQPPKDEQNVPGFQPFPVSPRVSLNARGVKYDIGSDGANVGLNFDSTVGPGQSIQYRWYAQDEFGLGVLQDNADVENHLHHGLYGGLIIEPKGSKYLDPKTGGELKSGQEAVITNPDQPDFRENNVLMNSDLALFQSNGDPVADNRDLTVGAGNVLDDPEDQGEVSIGYRNEPWNHRFQNNPDISLIFSSAVHGDPATPLFRAYSGDPVRFRVAQAEGDPRSTGFALHGHSWRTSPNDPNSPIVPFQGQFNPAVTYNIHLDPKVTGGAGGPNGFPGDYLYRSGSLEHHLPGGQWGIMRVFGQPQTDLIQLPDHPI